MTGEWFRIHFVTDHPCLFSFPKKQEMLKSFHHGSWDIHARLPREVITTNYIFDSL